MLTDGQLYNFKITVILAIVGQSLGMLWMLWGQVRGRGWRGCVFGGGLGWGAIYGVPNPTKPRLKRGMFPRLPVGDSSE